MNLIILAYIISVILCAYVMLSSKDKYWSRHKLFALAVCLIPGYNLIQVLGQVKPDFEHKEFLVGVLVGMSLIEIIKEGIRLFTE